MARMFCTVQEAARTLNTSADRINALVERGILQEFREGPHRLVRAADVGALDLGRGSPQQAQPPVRPHRMANTPPAPSHRRTTPHREQRTTACGRKLEIPSGAGRPTCGLSVRQWFWVGLVQDQPVVLALLSGLVLLGLAALAAGICLLQDL